MNHTESDVLNWINDLDCGIVISSESEDTESEVEEISAISVSRQKISYNEMLKSLDTVVMQ